MSRLPPAQAFLLNPIGGVTTTQQAGGTPEESAKQKSRPLLPRAPQEVPLTPWARINIQQRGQSWTKSRAWPSQEPGLPGPGRSRCRRPGPGAGSQATEMAAVAESAAHPRSPPPGEGDAAAWPRLSGLEGTWRPPQASRPQQSATARSQPGRTSIIQAPSPRPPGTKGAKLVQIAAENRPGPDSPVRGREPCRQPPPLQEAVSRGGGGQEAAGGPGDRLPDPQLPRAALALGSRPATHAPLTCRARLSPPPACQRRPSCGPAAPGFSPSPVGEVRVEPVGCPWPRRPRAAVGVPLHGVPHVW